MRKLLLMVSMLLTYGSAFAKAVETPFLVCQTEDKKSWVQLSFFKEKNQYDIQISPITSSPHTASLEYWTSGKISKQTAEQIKATFTKTDIVERNLPIEITADSGARITAYSISATTEGEVVAIVAGYYGDTLKNYLQFVNCTLQKK